MNLQQELTKVLNNSEVLADEPLSEHCTFKIGGRAKVFVTPYTIDALVRVIAVCREVEAPYFVLGRGSNTLFADEDIGKVIISTAALNKLSQPADKPNTIRAAAGALLKNIAEYAMGKSLAGFEPFCGIPGTLGGAVCMNAGAHGAEIADVLESALILDENGQPRRVPKEELEFAYRESAVLNNGLVVLEGDIVLGAGYPQEIKKKMDENMALRNSKQPVEFPSAGSVFKRPKGEGIYAAALIEECEMKGHTIGGAQVSEKHSGFFINIGDATARDVLDLVKHVQGVVMEKKAIMLEPEVVFVGND